MASEARIRTETALVLLMLTSLLMMWMAATDKHFTHEVGWEHLVCVETGRGAAYRVHCATGAEIAAWAQEHGR